MLTCSSSFPREHQVQVRRRLPFVQLTASPCPAVLHPIRTGYRNLHRTAVSVIAGPRKLTVRDAIGWHWRRLVDPPALRPAPPAEEFFIACQTLVLLWLKRHPWEKELHCSAEMIYLRCCSMGISIHRGREIGVQQTLGIHTRRVPFIIGTFVNKLCSGREQS
jgi:hypothetical protein